jgi:bacterioferritin-associated ferredoxin
MKLKAIFNFKMFVCLCRGVSDRTIQRALDAGADSVEEVARRTGAGTCCGRCKPAIAAMVEQSAGACAHHEERRGHRLDVLPASAA